ncbi:MAG: FAD-dependent thymidylate synthase [Phycisphaerales bacterium JB039]
MTQMEAKPGPARADEMEQPPHFQITDERPEGALVDVMGGAERRTIRLHEHGFISLVDVMPRLVPEGQTADAAIVQAARVSYGAGTKKVHEDRGLIRYLLRHQHTTPFEMVEFKFHIAIPIFVARQWIRHRTANVNEYSGRYSVMPDRFYKPPVDQVRKQSSGNRQGGEERFWAPEGTEAQRHEGTERGDREREFATAREIVEYLEQVEGLYSRYEQLIEKGVSRELARIGLPTSQYTQWYWKCDLHNVLRFLSLRMDAHAQQEIRDYAEAMCALIEPIVPVTMEAWRDYSFGAVRLTRLEIEALRDLRAGGSGELPSDNKRERAEWAAKRARLGFGEAPEA